MSFLRQPVPWSFKFAAWRFFPGTGRGDGGVESNNIIHDEIGPLFGDVDDNPLFRAFACVQQFIVDVGILMDVLPSSPLGLWLDRGGGLINGVLIGYLLDAHLLLLRPTFENSRIGIGYRSQRDPEEGEDGDDLTDA